MVLRLLIVPDYFVADAIVCQIQVNWVSKGPYPDRQCPHSLNSQCP